MRWIILDNVINTLGIGIGATCFTTRVRIRVRVGLRCLRDRLRIGVKVSVRKLRGNLFRANRKVTVGAWIRVRVHRHC